MVYTGLVNSQILKKILYSVKKRQNLLKMFFRFVLCVTVWIIAYFLVINLLTPEPAVFSLKSGEFKCDDMVECVEAAKESAIKKWENQKQILEYADRWNQFVGFSILPIRYEIQMENRSYNQIETTGYIGEKRQLPARVVCAENPLIEIWSHTPIKVAANLELNEVYSNMEVLLQKFDGCYFDITHMNSAINESLKKDRLIVSPNEYVKISEEREFSFPTKPDRLSKFFIAVQLLIFLPVLFLVSPKPIFKFIQHGLKYYSE